MMDKLKVLEETNISPPPGSVPPTSLPCTYFDLLFLDGSPVKFLFFYRSPPERKTTILASLKHSLSLALKHYYPLAGNLRWPQQSTKPELTYRDGDSVAFTVAESDFSFDELSSTRVQDLDVFVPLHARFRDVNTFTGEKLVPLTAFQVTFLGDKGICLGITFSHIVSDGNTIFSFIKAWTSLHTSAKDFQLPFYDRSSIFKGLEKKETAVLDLLKESKVSSDTFHRVINSGNVVPKDVVQATFIITRTQIQRLKKEVSAEIDQQPTPAWLYFSSFSVTCAYTWVCFIKARWEGHQSSSGEATEHLILPVDIRTRLDSPVPITYFGNCGASLEVTAKRSDLLGMQGIVIAAKLIRKAIQGIDVYGELEKDTSYYASLPPEQILCVGSFPKFGAYNSDFGWGRPKRFLLNTFENEFGNRFLCIFFNDCPNDYGGIEIGFVAEPSEVNAFAYAFANSLAVRSMM